MTAIRAGASETKNELVLQARALNLAALEWGNRNGPRVLALHGWLDNAGSFSAIAPLLPGAHLVALDFPGHGHSDHRPPGTRYHFVDYVEDVLAAADALGWSDFTLVGHSLGGAVATLVAAACPQRVGNLVLIEATGPLTVEPAGTIAQMRRALDRAQQAGSRSPPVYADIDRAIEVRRAATEVTTEGMGRDAATLLVERGIRPVAGGFTWRTDPRLRLPSTHPFTEDQALAILSAIEAPTRLIAGDRGLTTINPERTERRIAAIGDARVHRLPGHHHLHLEDPEPVARIVANVMHD